jgi:hypothetical protein
MRYTAATQTTPVIETELQSGERKQRSGPITLPGTFGWGCHKSRTADLGTFEIAQGSNRLTISSMAPSDIHIYSLWMVRLPSSAPAESGSFTFDSYSASANHIVFRSHQTRDGFILLNEIYYPGWQADVDGKPVEILRADGIFRALFTAAGDHRIEFRFRPRHFAWGAAISLLTLLGYLGYVALIWRKRRFGARTRA